MVNVYYVTLLVLIPVLSSVVQASDCPDCPCLSSQVTPCGPLRNVYNGGYLICESNGIYSAVLVCKDGFNATNPDTVYCNPCTYTWEYANGDPLDDCPACEWDRRFSGTQFYATIIRSTTKVRQQADVRNQIICYTDTTANIDITSSNPLGNQNGPASDTAVFSFDLAMTLSADRQPTDQAMKIVTSEPSTCFALSLRGHSGQVAADMWILRPPDLLSNRYILITTPKRALFAVVGTVDNTDCELLDRDGIVVESFTVNEGEAYLYFKPSRNLDLTGYQLECTEYLPAYSGFDFTTAPDYIPGSKDAGIIQLPAVSDFYTQCIAGRFAPDDAYIIKTVASEDGTIVNYNKGGIDLPPINLDAYEYYRLIISDGDYVIVTSNKPTLTVYVSTTTSVRHVKTGDPSIVECTDVNLYASFFKCPILTTFNINKMRVIMKSASIENLRLDGNCLNMTNVEQIYVQNGFTILYIDAIPGATHTLMTIDGSGMMVEAYSERRVMQASYMCGLGRI